MISIRKNIKVLFLFVPILSFASQPSNTTNKTLVVKKMISAPITKFHKARIGTDIFVGKNNTSEKKAFVEIDTGSSRLVIEKQYLTNYQATDKKITINYGYGNLKSKIIGELVYSDVTFNTQPKVTAKHVPIIMVPNGTFKGYAGILGLKLATQNSPWNYLPSPYNQLMIIDGPKQTISFGASSKETLNKYTTYKIKNTVRCHNTVIPRYPINQTKCWDPNVPIRYTLVNKDGEIIFDKTINTLLDSGGYYTHILLHKIPEELKQYVKNGRLVNSKIKSALFTSNDFNIPITTYVRASKHREDKVNSGHALFYDKSVLFDSANGIIGVK
ncbi:hypothetical protein [Francisella sp. LA112445]|uniref:hypothetical protein n=1 Tax=Francisella sp. LA112445 TaxID=1395624 RepID=UPI001788A203|nr:hypothetical protein [Francisella sp. LA112445]QIW10702.1 hypothetical protein FIP56_08300 [Francisella sp. LA112445]